MADYIENNLTCDDFQITPNFNAEDYTNNWSGKLFYIVQQSPDDECEKVFLKLYGYVWNLLFGPDATPETRTLAIELLVAQRYDAGYHNPSYYNEWIPNVKAEIIKRELFDLWRDGFVKNDLGLYWAGNCGEFYDHGDIPEAEVEELLSVPISE